MLYLSIGLHFFFAGKSLNLETAKYRKFKDSFGEAAAISEAKVEHFLQRRERGHIFYRLFGACRR